METETGTITITGIETVAEAIKEGSEKFKKFKNLDNSRDLNF